MSFDFEYSKDLSSFSGFNLPTVATQAYFLASIVSENLP
jgi:hypothetical protein